MARTIFNTPVIRTVGHYFGKFWLEATGWKVVNDQPDIKKYVMVAGPHTSNWDFWYLLLSVLQQRMAIRWMGKHTLFPQGLGWLTRWLGGVPVERSTTHNLTSQMIDALNRADEMILAITPEGTRGQVTKWKTGFYHIAHGAGVPVVMVFCDYAKKETGFGPIIEPSGDIDSQLPAMQEYYRSITGKFSQGAIADASQTAERPD